MPTTDDHRRRGLARVRPVTVGVAAAGSLATVGVAVGLAVSRPADASTSTPVTTSPSTSNSAPARSGTGAPTAPGTSAAPTPSVAPATHHHVQHSHSAGS